MYTKSRRKRRRRLLEAAARLPKLTQKGDGDFWKPRAAAFAVTHYFDLQQYDAGLVAGFDHFIGPDGTVHLSDVCLAQEEHTDT